MVVVSFTTTYAVASHICLFCFSYASASVFVCVAAQNIATTTTTTTITTDNSAAIFVKHRLHNTIHNDNNDNNRI